MPRMAFEHGGPARREVCAVLACSLLSACGWAGTITIPGDYEELAEAVHIAPDGTTVVLDGGTHKLGGSVRVHGKSLVIKGQNGAVIDGSLLSADAPMVRVSSDPKHRGAVVIEGVTFTNGANRETTIGGDGAIGGAVLAEWGDMTLRGCSFRRNLASFGGAVGMVGTGGLRIESCAFDANGATSDGGAVAARDGSVVRIVGSVFTGNEAFASGGALATSGRSTVVDITSTRFIKNRAETDGGAVSFADRPTVVIDRSVFAGNSARSRGGAVMRLGGDLEILQCSFTGNAAQRGGAIATGLGGDVVIRSSTLIRNQGVEGADVFAGGSPLLQAFNTIVWSGADSITGDAAVTARLSHCLVRGTWGGFGDSNIDGNPMLRDVVGPDGVDGTGDEDLRPRSGSPVIDAGENAELGGATSDLGGATRRVYDRRLGYRSVESDLDKRADIGAYEYQGGEKVSCVADVAAPFGVIDNEDVRVALDLLQSGDARVDVATPFGVVDANDAVTLIEMLSRHCR